MTEGRFAVGMEPRFALAQAALRIRYLSNSSRACGYVGRSARNETSCPSDGDSWGQDRMLWRGSRRFKSCPQLSPERHIHKLRVTYVPGPDRPDRNRSVARG